MATNVLSSKNHGVDNNNANNVVLIWLDPSVNIDEYSNAQKKLASIHRNFTKFTSMTDGKKAIKQLAVSNRIILIVSGGFGKELVSRIHQLEQVLTIYVFCMNREKHIKWAKQYDKIKAVIVDLDQLVSMIESDHEQRMNKKTTGLIAVPNTNLTSEIDNTTTLIYKTTDGFRYSYKYLVTAGELQYTEKTMEDIARDIVNKYKNDPSPYFKAFIAEAIQPVMYMLKRQQNLADFFDTLKIELSESVNMPSVSQRLLIDIIMMNSDRFLRRILISLLSKRNPVPFIQPPIDFTKNQYRSIMSVIHIWDYQRPILLSFGIGQYQGKTSLINAVFETNFEETIDDRYFNGTIDVDFGFHFIERRPINIADAHGEISLDTLNKISMLFNGFLVHIEWTYLCSNQANIIKYLTTLPCRSYIQLLIRDVHSANDPKLKSSVDAIRSACSTCQISYLLNVADKNSLQNKMKIKKLRENIFHDAIQLRCFDEVLIQEHLEKLLDRTEKQIIEQEKAFIQRIRPVLVKSQLEHYPLYSLFMKMCKKRLKIAKINPYGRDFESDELYQLNDELFKADSEFQNKQKLGPENYGAGFNYFFELLDNPESCVTHLHLLSMELTREREKQITKHQDGPFYEQLTLAIHWRNIIIGSTSLPYAKQQMLINAYRNYIVEGNPFEIVDGDNFEIQGHFLTKVFQLFPNKKFFVISVIGPQNSGKSTLLNFLFGASFEARDGRCTKGIYGTLVNIQNRTSTDKLVPLEYDYILVIDTEGLLSVQKSDEQYDKSLILFCLAVSHLVIVNVEGEISEPVKKCFVLCTQALKYLGETRVRRPTVHFVLNKRKDSNIDYCKTLIECVQKALYNNKLNNEINLQTENFHILPIAFHSKPLININGECAASLTIPTFMTNVQKLCQYFIDISSLIIRETGDAFCVPINWIHFANRVLQTIKKHPDLTYFQDVFERHQYREIREDIRQDFDQYLSPAVARVLMEKEKQNDSEHIKKSFKIEYNRLLRILEDKLHEHCDKHEATESIRERSLQFMQVQLINIFRSWEVSTIMKSERYKNNRIVIEIDTKLREKASSITHKDYLMNQQAAREMFETKFDYLVAQNIAHHFKSELVWTQSITLVSHLCDVLHTDALPSADNLLVYVPFLTTLDLPTDQPISIHSCLSAIRVECLSRVSNLGPLVSCSLDTSQTISIKDIEQSYRFLDNDELSKIFVELHRNGQQSRRAIRQGVRQQYSKIFQENWKVTVKVSTCFRMLTHNVEKCLISKQGDELSNEITFVQDILGVVNKIIQDFNNELHIFSFCLSKEFCSSLYICAVILTALYYYNQHKSHFLHVVQNVRENKSKLVKKYIPWVVLVDNDDENVAMNFINELSQVLVRQTFKPQVKMIIENNEDKAMKSIKRSIIIQELDGEVNNATDDWLIRYVLDPQQLIIERFEQKWLTFKTATDGQLSQMINLVSVRLMEIFHILNTMNTVLQEQGGHSLTFVDELFEVQGDRSKCISSDKKFCMAKLFYGCLIDQQLPKEIAVQSGSIYTVDSRWTSLADNFPKPSEEIKQIFRSTENAFETATIRYLGLFLDKILGEQSRTELAITDQMNSLITTTYSIMHDSLLKQVQGCGARCPCCKRVCDIDHHLNVISPIGQRANRHRCQFGHQIRGMGGIHYEITAEASMAWCEIIKDDDPITTNNGIRQTWKTFKNANADWNFSDPISRENFETRYFSIWKRIGRNLCDYFGHGMKFVEKNSPSSVNHFIFVLDHSDSMNESNRLLFKLSPWENLLQAIRVFLDIRIRQVSLNDQITAIVFGKRAERIYNREKLKDIDIERLKIPMTVCGKGTRYSTAFQMVIQTLEEANNHQERNRFRQTIIFMTDGEPLDDSTAELQKLCDWREGIASNPTDKALINHFWTMALGKFNKKVIKEINQKIHGKLVNIEHSEDLIEAYAQVAEIL